MKHCFEYPLVDDPSVPLHSLVVMEDAARGEVFDRVTDIYHEAQLFGTDFVHGHTLSPVPDSVSFRLDTKLSYLNKVDNSIEPHHLYIFIPESEKRKQRIGRFFFEHVVHGDESPLYEVGAEYYGVAARPDDETKEIPRITEEQIQEALELGFESMFDQERQKMLVALGGLKWLVQALRGRFTLVPYNS
jgi:hypothetical protein